MGMVAACSQDGNTNTMYGILSGYSIVKSPYKGAWHTVGPFGKDNIPVDIMMDEATNEDSRIMVEAITAAGTATVLPSHLPPPIYAFGHSHKMLSIHLSPQHMSGTWNKSRALKTRHDTCMKFRQTPVHPLITVVAGVMAGANTSGTGCQTKRP